jgi:hypothetical protein
MVLTDSSFAIQMLVTEQNRKQELATFKKKRVYVMSKLPTRLTVLVETVPLVVDTQI